VLGKKLLRVVLWIGLECILWWDMVSGAFTWVAEVEKRTIENARMAHTALFIG